MTPLQFLLIFRAHYKPALAVFLLSIGVGVAICFLWPKKYVATVTVVMDVQSADPVAASASPAIIPGYMMTQVDVIQSDRVAQNVIKVLALDQSPIVKDQWKDDTGGKGKLVDWFSGVLLQGLTAVPSPTSNVIAINYVAADPAFAALIANSFARVYLDTSIELRADPAREYTRWFGDQGKTLRGALEKAQATLSKFQQEKGIVAKDEQMDNETAVLTHLSQQLGAAQGVTVDAQVKQNSGTDTLPEISQNSSIQNLRLDISRQEAKLAEAANNLGKNHPQYVRMQSEIDALKTKLEAEKQLVTNGFSTSRKVSHDREVELTAAIEAQKKKLIELKAVRDQLAVLQRDVDFAQSAYDGVSKRYNQTSLESQITQTNLSILSPATAPLLPTIPNIPKVLLGSLLVGILLGAGTAYGLEMLNRRIRCVEDLADMLQLPVLAVIEQPKQPKKLLFLRRKPPLELEHVR